MNLEEKYNAILDGTFLRALLEYSGTPLLHRPSLAADAYVQDGYRYGDLRIAADQDDDPTIAREDLTTLHQP
jgi:hypothetical protein